MFNYILSDTSIAFIINLSSPDRLKTRRIFLPIFSFVQLNTFMPRTQDRWILKSYMSDGVTLDVHFLFNTPFSDNGW